MDLERKALAVTDIQTNATKGEFIADVAVFGNIDRVNDRINPGAFKKAIAEDPPPPIIYNHQHDMPPIGETIEWAEHGQKSLRIKGALFVDGEDDHPFARMVYAGMKSRGGRPPALRDFSFVYGIPEGGAKISRLEGKAIRDLYELQPIAEVGPCLRGINGLAGTVMAPKGELFVPLEAKADWTTEYVDDLPDSAFLYVEPGGKRSDGKTDPRSNRHFPYKDAKGVVDLPHLRDAIDRAPQSDLPSNVQDQVQSRGRRILASQQGKALILSGLELKAWDDIDGYCVTNLLDMLEDAVGYIQTEDDPGNVAQMQGVAKTLLAMVDGEFAELASSSGDDAASAKSLWLSSREFFLKGLALPSDVAVTVTQGAIRSLLLEP